MRILIFLLSLSTFLLTGPLSAQQKSFDFRTEIGLDGAPFVHGDVGASLVIKHAIGLGTVRGRVLKNNALRLWGGYYRENIGLQGSSIPFGDSLIQHFITNPEKRNAFVFAGWERRSTRGRWRLYYGLDAGYRRSFYSNDNESRITLVSADSVVSRNFYQGEVRTQAIQIAGFLGCQYFLSNHFSLGVEAGLDFGLEKSRSDLLRDGNVYFSDDSLVGDANFRFFRLIYASWHFGKPVSVVPLPPLD